MRPEMSSNSAIPACSSSASVAASNRFGHNGLRRTCSLMPHIQEVHQSELHSTQKSLSLPRNERAESFSGGSSSPLQKSRGGKSGGGLVFQRLAKRFSKISRKGNSERRNEEKDRESGSAKERHSNAELSDTIDGGGGGEREKKAKSSKKLRPRSSSVSNLESVESPGRRAQSMDNLSPSENKTFDARGFSTPGSTPTGTPSMTRSSSKTKLGRRGSEPDLEGALSSLFRSGSKKNLAMDPSEALFEYIEQGNADGVQQLLEANMIAELNGTNEDDFTPVDAAVMLGHHSIARMLLAKGAKDSAKFCRDPFSRFTRLTALLMDSERELESLKCDLLTVGATSNVRDLEQRLRRWEWRAHLFRKMKAIYEQADPPCPPANVTLHITSNRTLTVRWSEPDQCNKATVTRYKIEWSNSELYAPSMGEFIMTDLRNFDYTIPDLTKGERYYVRVSAFNMKGWGQPRMATPLFAVPSSWHDLDRSQPRFEGCTDKIHTLAAQLSLTLSNSPPLSPTFGAPPSTSSKKSMKKGISKLFGSAVKFQKSLKPGVYIATLVYSDEGKIVVTVDDNIPMVEVSDSRSSSVGADFVWLAKLSCTWDHIRGMKETSDNYTSSPAVLFRNKILTAILSLQGALGMQDLGILHPIPYRDAHGAIVFIIVQYVQDSRSLQGISLKWSTLPRLWKKRTQPLPTADHGGMARDIGSFPVPDQIILDAQDIIAHHCNSTRPLTRGLYLGYLKARSSVASMKVICSREYPNVLPHIKIRENPNISSEEWAWLQSLRSPSSADAQPHPTDPSSQSLQKTLLPTIDTFLHNLRISKENVEKHQLYCHEVIELNENISLILLLPPHDQVCTPPGSTDHFVDLPAFSALPINTFEIMQLYTYQKSFMTRFSMVSARLDIELLTSQQRLREAFSKEEVTQAKHIQTDLESYQEQTDSTWKQMRWIEEALQRGRDPSADTSAVIPIRTLRENVSSHPPNGMTIRRAAMVQTVQRAGPSHGYLRVFPAYNTGLAKGTSVKLYITIKTTTIEVIRLVVQQLEKARYEKGLTDRGLTEDDLSDFYLVCYSGNSEWTLEGSFNPLQLQAQASKCRLFVKRYSEELVIDEQATTV